MNDIIKKSLENLIPFLVFGVAISLAISLLVLFSHVVFWGFLIGLMLWIIFAVKDYFFPENTPKKSRGRVIDHKNND